MRTGNLVNRVVALVLIGLLAISGTALASKGKNNGKKYFKEGLKLETAEKWDQAAEQYALALNEEPGNAEYVVHYKRSLVKASLMFMDRGRRFEESLDWSSAYQAYRQAYSYDPSNEAAKGKMKVMLDKQGIPNNNGTPITKEQAEKQVMQTDRVVNWKGEELHRIPNKTKSVPTKSDISFKKGMQVRQVIQSLTKSLKLNVIFDEAFTDKPLKDDFELQGVTTAHALDLFLLVNKIFYTQADVKTIIVAQDTPQNRQRYQELFVRTFYIRNGDLSEIRTMIQQQVGTKMLAPIKNLNALVVRDSAPNLQLIEALINSVDKTPAEVLIDVNMYEISHTDMLQIGNQFNASGSTGIPGLSNLGGLFTPLQVVTSSTSTTTSSGNTTTTPTTSTVPLFNAGITALLGPGVALGLPPSTISFLQNKGRSKLLHSSQVRAFEGEETETKVGESVPIETAQLPYYNTGLPAQTTTGGTTTGTGSTLTNALNPLAGATGYPQIQYKDVGLVIKMKPKVNTSGDVNLKMHIESTGVENQGSLTPTFTQRSMDGTAQTKDGQTEMIAGVLQTDESNTVSGMPLVGLVPILGRFFATPTHTTNQTDIIVTVTPHILRAATFDTDDTKATPTGDQTYQGAKISIQDIVDRYNDYESVEDAVNREIALRDAGKTPQRTTNGTPPVTNVNVVDKPNPNPPLPPPEPVSATSVLPSGGQVNLPTKTDQKDSSKTTNTKKASGSTGEVEGDDTSDTSDDQEQMLNGPVTLSVRNNVSQAKVGQTVIVAIMANGASDLLRARMTLNFNSDVLTLRQVRDGGMFRLGGVNPEMTQNDGSGGQLVASIVRPPDSKPVRANGQLFILVFEATGTGNCDLTIDPGTSEFIGAAGSPVQLNVVPGKVTVIQ